jgi:uncharacterized protein
MDYNRDMKKTVVVLIIFFLTAIAWSQDLPRYQGYVNDYAGMIDSRSAAQIEAVISSIERSTGVEIAVVTITNLESRFIEEEALRYLEGWGVGKKGEDNGLVILVDQQGRRVRIEVGYGLEGVLPDGLAGEIIRYEIIPRFKQGDYGGGLLAAIYKIGKIVGGETVAYPKTSRKRSNIGGLIYLLIIIFIIISAFSGRKRGSRLGLLFFLTGFGLGRSGSWGSSSGGFGGFGGFGGGTGGGGGATGGW